MIFLLSFSLSLIFKFEFEFNFSLQSRHHNSTQTCEFLSIQIQWFLTACSMEFVTKQPTDQSDVSPSRQPTTLFSSYTNLHTFLCIYVRLWIRKLRYDCVWYFTFFFKHIWRLYANFGFIVLILWCWLWFYSHLFRNTTPHTHTPIPTPNWNSRNEKEEKKNLEMNKFFWRWYFYAWPVFFSLFIRSFGFHFSDAAKLIYWALRFIWISI